MKWLKEDDELEDAWIDWWFLEGMDLVDRIQIQGYRWLYVDPEERDISEYQAEAPGKHLLVIRDEFPGGAIVASKQLIPPMVNALGLLVVDHDTRAAMAKHAILDYYEGREVPIELAKPSGNEVALIHPATRPEAKWQGSMFDKNGPYSHVEGKSVDQVIDKLIEDGFRVPEEGALDRILGDDPEAWWVPGTHPKENPWGRPDFKFVGTEDILAQLREAEPDPRHVEELGEPEDGDFHGRLVSWRGGPSYVLRIPASNVLFMEGNQWNFEHGAALLELAQAGDAVFELPAARVYRIDKSRVKDSQKYEEEGELEYQLGMVEPWDDSDVGTYYAQLLDGNHRAAAAIAAGESFIYVYVGENYRDNVRKKDWE